MQLLGYTLRPAGASLLKEVETLYGKNVRGEKIDSGSSTIYGKSKIDVDGTPVIILTSFAPSSEVAEMTIVHELFHLKMWAEGFFIYTFKNVKNIEKFIDSKIFLSDIHLLLHDPILHNIMYPQMQKMGYKPYEDAKTIFRRLSRGMIKLNGEIYSVSPNLRKILFAINYYQLHLEIDNEKELLRVTKWFKQKGLNSSIDLGRKLIKLVRQSAPKTPKEVSTIYNRCLNTVFQDIALFEFSETESETLGSFQRHRIAVETRVQ